MFWALNAVNLLRVSKEGELIGLDIDQHGISAYPEYDISGASPIPGKGAEFGPSGAQLRPEMTRT